MPNLNQFETREEWLDYYRNYRKKNIEKMRAYGREYNRLYRKKHGYHNENKWKKENRVKVNIEQMTRHAIKRGEIKRRPCALCGNEKSVAHHPSYKKPLKVIFLCHLHHRKYHYKINKKIPSAIFPRPSLKGRNNKSNRR